MNLIRAFVGVIAVIFSIQPLMSWAAKSKSSNETSLTKTVTLERGDGKDKDGSPTCGGIGG